MNLQETRIPNMYQQNLRAISLDWEPLDTPAMYGTVILAISMFLGDAKIKDEKVAIVIEDLKGNFKMAGVVQYHKNEENPDMPGNWSFILTFDPEDVKDAKIHKSNDTYFQRFMSSALYERFGYGFEGGYIYIQDMTVEAINVLIDWLDKNAGDGDCSVELDGFFKASVAVENGKKEFSIVPDGSMKRLIKGDAAIQQ